MWYIEKTIVSKNNNLKILKKPFLWKYIFKQKDY
jgi:hypothetical protein